MKIASWPILDVQKGQIWILPSSVRKGGGPFFWALQATKPLNTYRWQQNLKMLVVRMSHIDCFFVLF